MIWAAQDFLDNTGQEPEQDDLDRANCEEAGQLGHWGCGICIHKQPVFMCPECFPLSSSKIKIKRL